MPRRTTSPPKTLAEITREARRAALLKALDANGWNLTATARAMGMTCASNVARTLETLGLEDRLNEARADGRVARGARKRAAAIATG